MHEMSIAVALMEQLEDQARQNGIARITGIVVKAGVMRGVVPEAMALAFEAVTQGTIAQGAKLELEIVSALARCRHCGAQFQPEIDYYLCEKCQQADVELIQGDEILLSSLECTLRDGDDHGED
jgi:hydrogenase nickel incorporation protein HypA/HybF